jgi:hypothetical protein
MRSPPAESRGPASTSACKEEEEESTKVATVGYTYNKEEILLPVLYGGGVSSGSRVGAGNRALEENPIEGSKAGNE